MKQLLVFTFVLSLAAAFGGCAVETEEPIATRSLAESKGVKNGDSCTITEHNGVQNPFGTIICAGDCFCDAVGTIGTCPEGSTNCVEIDSYHPGQTSNNSGWTNGATGGSVSVGNTGFSSGTHLHLEVNMNP